MDVAERNMAFNEGSHIQMSVPERIVLSAGYDGDDNRDNSQSFTGVNGFYDTPLVNPDLVMAGMETPPSVLTINHSVTKDFINTPSASSYNSKEDGVTEVKSDVGERRNSQLRFENENSEKLTRSVVVQERSLEQVSRERDYGHNSMFDDPDSIQNSVTNMQRRMTILENKLAQQNRSTNMWKFLLFTFTLLNPFLINYFFSSRRR